MLFSYLSKKFIRFQLLLLFWLSFSIPKLVESTLLWKLHDLHGNEAKSSDGICLVPTGFETILSAKSQQYAFHCDTIENEIKLVMT